MLQGILEWLTSLPPLLLYLTLAGSAALENVFPPFPADTIVAFGAFLAAHGDASLIGAFLATWIGNVAGALFMLWLGRRFGAEPLRQRFTGLGDKDGGSSRKIEELYDRYGVPALFVSRFLPGARALVPPLAGAMRAPVLTAGLAIAAASGIWYGTIAWLAYRIGSHWGVLVERMGSLGRWSALVALAVVLAAVGYWLVRRQRHRSEPLP